MFSTWKFIFFLVKKKSFLDSFEGTYMIYVFSNQTWTGEEPGRLDLWKQDVGVASGGLWGICRLLWEAGCTHFREEPDLQLSAGFPTLAVGEIIGSWETPVTPLSCNSWPTFTLSSHWAAGHLVGSKGWTPAGWMKEFNQTQPGVAGIGGGITTSRSRAWGWSQKDPNARSSSISWDREPETSHSTALSLSFSFLKWEWC